MSLNLKIHKFKLLEYVNLNYSDNGLHEFKLLGYLNLNY